MSTPEFDDSESSDAMDGPGDVAEAYAAATSAVQAGRGPVLDEIARHLCEDLIARAGGSDLGPPTRTFGPDSGAGSGRPRAVPLA